MNQKYCLVIKKRYTEVAKFFSSDKEKLEYIAQSTYRENDGYTTEIVDNIPEPKVAPHCRSKYPFNLES